MRPAVQHYLKRLVELRFAATQRPELRILSVPRLLWRCLIRIERLEAKDDHTNNRVSLLRLLLWICVVPNDCFPRWVYLVNRDLSRFDAPPLSE